MPRTLENIDRLQAPSKALVEEYVGSGRPFICPGLLAGSRIEAFHDRDATIAILGDGKIAFDGSGKSESRSVADYFRQAEVGPGSVNVDLPPALAQELVDFARGTPIGRGEMGMLAWMGRTGCLQRFHCDMDARHNFLVQAFGTKRVCLVSPAQTQKLQPSLERRLLFSEVPFHRFSDDEKLAMLQFVDGRDAILDAGETLYIPPLWWHSIEYLSDSFSLSWRFAHLPFLRELGGLWQFLWPSEWPLWQGIIWRFSSQPSLAETHGTQVRELMSLVVDRDARARARLRELHDELCPERYRIDFGPADRPFFEVRTERPPPPKLAPWRSDEVPRVRPYTRFAALASAGGGSVLVLDGERVVARVPIDGDDFDIVAALLGELQRADGKRDVAALADALSLDAESACSVLAPFSAEGWIVV